MSEYPNSGILSRNDKRKEGSNQPEFTGKATIDAVEYKIAGWVRETKDGSRKFFSLKFEPVQHDAFSGPAVVRDDSVADSEVPF